MNENNSTRLNKYISESGLCSRREADRFIEQGLVFINGVRAKIGRQVFAGDRVVVNGEPIEPKTEDETIFIALNKPVGITCTTEAGTKNNIVDYVKYGQRIFPIGRLDKDSEGIILLTNDGDLAHRATHPSYGLEKRYLVEVEGEFNKQMSDQLLQGVRLEDGLARAMKVVHARAVSKNHHWVEITIHEGRFHIIRRLIESLGLKVLRLIRLDFGPINLGDMKPGRHRVLNSQEMTNLFTLLKLNK